MADTSCPNCDHVYVVDELVDGWCVSCGRKIPEVLLKEARPKVRPPHPIPPPPPPTAAQRAVLDRESKIRALGFMLMLLALGVGFAAAAWLAYCHLNRESGGIVVWLVGAGAVVVFLTGLVMLAINRVPGE